MVSGIELNFHVSIKTLKIDCLLLLRNMMLGHGLAGYRFILKWN